MTALGCATAASMAHGISVEDIMSAKKHRKILRARWYAWRLARVHGWTFERIGREFDRSTDTVWRGLKNQYRQALNAR